MLQGILLVILVFVSIAMIGVILLQKSEGGALGTGGGPSGFMTTRGAGDFLSRTTAILAAVFFGLCIILTVVNGRLHHGESVVDRLKIDPLNPDSLVQKKPLAQPAPVGGAQGAAAPFTAPAPEVHTIPAAGATTAPAAPVKTPPRNTVHAAAKASSPATAPAAATPAPATTPAPTLAAPPAAESNTTSSSATPEKPPT